METRLLSLNEFATMLFKSDPTKFGLYPEQAAWLAWIVRSCTPNSCSRTPLLDALFLLRHSARDHEYAEGFSGLRDRKVVLGIPWRENFGTKTGVQEEEIYEGGYCGVSFFTTFSIQSNHSSSLSLLKDSSRASLIVRNQQWRPQDLTTFLNATARSGKAFPRERAPLWISRCGFLLYDATECTGWDAYQGCIWPGIGLIQKIKYVKNSKLSDWGSLHWCPWFLVSSITYSTSILPSHCFHHSSSAFWSNPVPTCLFSFPFSRCGFSTLMFSLYSICVACILQLIWLYTFTCLLQWEINSSRGEQIGWAQSNNP